MPCFYEAHPGDTHLLTVELADQTLNADDLKQFLQKFNPAAADTLPIFNPIDLDSSKFLSLCVGVSSG